MYSSVCSSGTGFLADHGPTWHVGALNAEYVLVSSALAPHGEGVPIAPLCRCWPAWAGRPYRQNARLRRSAQRKAVRRQLRERAATSVALSLLEARQRRLDELASCRLADVAVHQSDVAGSRDFGGLGHLPGIGNDVETPLVWFDH
jgi:hypothetical protein